MQMYVKYTIHILNIKCFYKNYVKNISKENNDIYFKCQHCNKEFTTKVLLNEHQIKEHNGEKMFRCNICCKEFRELKSLKKHQITHK